MFTILPYVEQESLFNMASGQRGWASVQSAGSPKRQKLVRLMQVPLTAFVCPSRRTAGPRRIRTTTFYNTDLPSPPVAGSTDYAANAGSKLAFMSTRFTGTYDQVDQSTLFPTAGQLTGVCFYRSEVRPADITDGTSNTYLVGEKYLNPDDYTTGMDYGDDDSCLTGLSGVQFRWANNDAQNNVTVPRPDAPGSPGYYNFGSAHSGGLNMALCDGSARTISYSIDLAIHERLGARNDGKPIDGTKY
jgi:prepilin-type processing-associated H-X9-DG protein